MKKFEEPKLNVETLELEDVITTSSDSGCTAGYDCPWVTSCDWD